MDRHRNRFIPATPTVSGADADALLASLEESASPEEMERRIAEAKERLRPNADGSIEYPIKR